MKTFDEYLNEAIYENNLGLIETVKFYEIAEKHVIENFEKLLNQDKIRECWQIIQNVVGVTLIGSEFK